MLRCLFYIVVALVSISNTLKVFNDPQADREEVEDFTRIVRAPFNGMRGKKDGLEGELQRKVIIIYITAYTNAA